MFICTDAFTWPCKTEAKTGGSVSGNKLYSVEDAAAYLGGLSKYTIHAWLAKGKMRRTKVGSRTMIRESELQRVIEDGGKSVTHQREEAA
jgi:excisionase family DNA binding protein